jgi:hypothetical protein
MTPKEKAEELTGKYWDLNYEWDGVTKDDWAKDAALIAASEILDVCLPCYSSQKEFNEFINYWIEVKQEIEKI